MPFQNSEILIVVCWPIFHRLKSWTTRYYNNQKFLLTSCFGSCLCVILELVKLLGGERGFTGEMPTWKPHRYTNISGHWSENKP